MHPVPLRLSSLLLVFVLGACSSLAGRDPLKVTVAGIEPIPGSGVEMRLAVKLRVQNPNDEPVRYTGVALTLDVNGHELASGVSADAGTVPRYGEAVLTVPVAISGFAMARQALTLMKGGTLQAVPYKMSGKLEGGAFGTHRFSSEGDLDLSAASGGP